MTNGLNAGVVMGAYHFARPDNNLATEDAANFLTHASPYIGPGFLPPVLDLENPYSGGQAILLTDLFTSNELSTWALEWMNIVENETGVAPIIYINGNYANYLNSSLNAYGLWFAQPDELMTPPTNLGNWSDWNFKQYSWWGEVSGKPAYAMIKRGAPAVEDESTARRLMDGDDFVWHGEHPDPNAPPMFKSVNGWYTKKFGDKSSTKIILGSPS